MSIDPCFSGITLINLTLFLKPHLMGLTASREPQTNFSINTSDMSKYIVEYGAN